MPVQPGSTIGPFKIQSLIGKGGMGEVFSALDIRLDRKVAVKILPPDFAADPDRLRRFESEAKTLASINHPNILSIFEVGAESGNPYLVSELLEGRTLREEIANGALPLRKALDYALQLAQGLAAAHARGIVHRDLKPENIFVNKEGRVKILDFGLAKLSIKDSTPLVSTAPTVPQGTAPGVTMGTPSYMAPEQVRSEPADHRSDIFAFGCVLYEMLTGRRAFQKGTAPEIMAAILNEEPPELAELAPNTSPALAQIARRCVEKSPERRFQSASDLAFALEALSGSSASVPALRAAPSGQMHVLRWSALAAILLLIGFLSFRAGRSQRVSSNQPPITWQAERLEGPSTAFMPRVSPDGKELAFSAMVEGQSQVALMNVDSGAYRVLTTNRSRGLVAGIGWSPDGSEIFYGRSSGGKRFGVFRVSKMSGEERLVLENASCRGVLPNGSVLVNRADPVLNTRLHLYSPATEQLRVLNSLPHNGMTECMAILPPAKVAFLGRTTNAPTASQSLWILDVESGRTEPFLTNLTSSAEWRSDSFVMAASPEKDLFYFDHAAGSLHRIFCTSLQSPTSITPLFTLTSSLVAMSADRNGNLFIDQAERPNEILRRKPGSQQSERIPLPATFDERQVLVLPENRFLYPASIHGLRRLMLLEQGRESRLWTDAALEANAPFARLGPDRVLFTVRDGGRLALRSASLDGRNIRSHDEVSWPRLENTITMSVAGSSDGKTIFFAKDNFIYAVPAAGGAPEKLCAGASVALDPHGKYIVAKGHTPEDFLLRYSLLDRKEEPLPLSKSYPLSDTALAPNAVDPDGRILLPVAPLDSWFWPAAILDPKTGETKLATEHPADMYSAGWDSDGALVTSAMFFRSSIWRFHPQSAEAQLK